MSALLDLYIKAETLETLRKTVQKKGDKGVALTVSINDETNKFGQNVTAFVAQSKEQREAGKEKFYVGNGKVFYLKDGISVAERKDQTQTQSQQSSDDDEDWPF